MFRQVNKCSKCSLLYLECLSPFSLEPKAASALSEGWAFWPAVLCLKRWRPALPVKGGDSANVMLAEDSVELLSYAGT